MSLVARGMRFPRAPRRRPAGPAGWLLSGTTVARTPSGGAPWVVAGTAVLRTPGPAGTPVAVRAVPRAAYDAALLAGTPVAVGPGSDLAALLPAGSWRLVADGQASPAVTVGAAPILLVVAGQSNARKAGTGGLGPGAEYGALAARMWVAGTGFAPYAIGVNSGHLGGPDSGVWGSEAEFIRLANAEFPGRPVHVVKVAVNGNAMRAVSGGDFAPGSSGERFAELVRDVAAARAAILAATGQAPVEVTLINQGEADATLVADAGGYAAAFAAFLAAYRAQVSTGLLVVERLRPRLGGDGADHYAATALVRKAQMDTALADGAATVIDADFEPAGFGTLHPGASWAKGCGARAYAAWAGTHDATYGPITDTTTALLSFADATGIDPAAVATSAAVAVTDIQRDAPVTVAGGEYRILHPGTDVESGTAVAQDWTATPGRLHRWQSIQLRGTASATPGATATVALTVGGVAATFAIVTAAAPARTLQAETTAFLATLAAHGGASMTTRQRDALDDLFIGLKADGLLAGRLKCLFVGALHDPVAARIDLADRTTLMAQSTAAGASPVPWTPAGWNPGNVSTRGLDCFCSPAAETAQNDAGLFVWINGTVTADAQMDLSSADGTFALRVNPTALRATLHSATNLNLAGLTNGPGFYAANRTGAATTTFYGPAGTSLGTASGASAAPTATQTWLGAPGGTGTTADRDVGAHGVFAGMGAAHVQALRDRLATFFGAFAP